MSGPSTPASRPIEAIRTATRRRFLATATFFAIGTLSLAASQGLARILGAVGVVTGLILGVLLQILGLIAGAYGATIFHRTSPLNESAAASQRLLVSAAGIVLPLSAALAATWTVLAVSVSALVLLVELPLFWGPISACAAVGLVYAARELASERMAILAGIGCGGIVAIGVSSAAWTVLAGASSIQSGRLAIDLLIATLGFLAIAISFERDAWAARGPRPGRR
jgi:hypothetical protein